MAWLYSYDTGAPTAPEAVAGYRAMSGIAVGVLFAVCTGLLMAYKLNKQATIEMSDQLAERRKRCDRQASPAPAG
jgi:Na+/melibiose symporter-like transporter